MKNVIIIREKASDYFLPKINNVRICNIYKSGAYNNLFFRFIRKFNLIFYIYFFNKEWTSQIKKYDYFIIFDNGYTNRISKYIKRKNKNIKIIMWFWNSINILNKNIIFDKNIDEFWSFDKNNCLEFGFKYNSQFYSNKVSIPQKNDLKYDCLFVGRNKGRKEFIKKVNTVFQKNGLKLKTFIIDDEDKIISYSDYLELLSNSKTILDIVANYQVGLSLRCMESLFLQKKLITNNLDIVNYDFYNKNNIFVLGIDDINKLSDFINSKYVKIDQKIVDNYDFESWLNRIIK